MQDVYLILYGITQLQDGYNAELFFVVSRNYLFVVILRNPTIIMQESRFGAVMHIIVLI